MTKSYLHKELELNWLKNKWAVLAIKWSLYLTLSAILLSLTWNAWSDILIDYGEQLYISWQITQGQVLYRDINNDYFGPLSFYINALWFYLFGVSINTLTIVNILLLIFLIYLLDNWLAFLSDRFSAAIAILVFLSIFAFSRYVGIGNYNYIGPYSYGIVHGLIIILAMLKTLRLWQSTRKIGWLLASGFLLGLTLLTKIEISFSAIATAVTYFMAIIYSEKENRKSIIKQLWLFILGVMAPCLITVLFFSRTMPPVEAVGSIFNQWLMIFNGGLSQLQGLKFYKTGMGLDDIPGNIIGLISWTWIYVNVVLTGIFLAFATKNLKHWKLVISGLIIATTVFLGYFLVPKQSWFEMVRSLPFILLMGFLFFLWQMFRHHKVLFDSSKLPFVLASFVFAGTLLYKMVLNVRLYHYGFALAMPASMLLVVIMVGWLPEYLNRYGAGWAFRTFSIGLFLITAVIYTEVSLTLYDRSPFICCTEETNQKGDAIRVDQTRGPIIKDAVAELEKILKPGQTLTVLPRGTMLNYLLRHRDSVGRYSIIFDLLASREAEVMNSFIVNPPDYVVFAHIDTSEQGFRFFGQDFGVNLNNWITKNYKTIWTEGDPLFEPKSKFGMSIAKKIKP